MEKEQMIEGIVTALQQADYGTVSVFYRVLTGVKKEKVWKMSILPGLRRQSRRRTLEG